MDNDTIDNDDGGGRAHYENAIPWVERYRPKNLSEVSHQTEIVATLTNAIETNRLPHLLFYGPPGTGKTSVALALCKQLWHPSHYRRRVLELNASDERGISVVRNKIKNFASQAVGTATVSHAVADDGTTTTYPNPPFKIIILDEADAVTPDAQAALRRVIEAYSKITRFILICNYVTRIISPLCSRCAKFRFRSLPPESMRQRLTEISRREKCRLENEHDVLTDVLVLSRGDMRRAVTMLQCAHALSGTTTQGVVRRADIAEISGRPPPDTMRDLMVGLTDGSFAAMETAVQNVIAEGYSAPTILSRLLEDLVLRNDTNDVDVDVDMDQDHNALTLTEEDMALLCIKIAESDKCLVDGADEYLQLMSVCSLASRCHARSKMAKPNK